MADEKLSIEELRAEQENLQAAHDKAQASFHSARKRYGKAKDALVGFNTKYGRFLKLIVVDPEEAEEPAAEEPPEPEPVAVAAPEPVPDPAGDGPFEEPVDTTNEE